MYQVHMGTLPRQKRYLGTKSDFTVMWTAADSHKGDYAEFLPDSFLLNLLVVLFGIMGK